MPQSSSNPAIWRQAELIIRRLSSLSTLPAVALQYFAKLATGQMSPADLAEVIESDAALTAKILWLANQQNLSFSNGKPSVKEAVHKLPATIIRDAVLSVKVFDAFDLGLAANCQRTLPPKQLAKHGLAVACCTKDIAKYISPDNEQMAFSAGLLHDIGKLAVDEAMPKSFEKIVQQAKTSNSSICQIEQELLKLDHTVIGKRLAEKWQLPNEIVFAIWLHHSDTEMLAAHQPDWQIAQIVQLADLIVRHLNIGQSGSFDSINSADLPALGQSLGLGNEQLSQIQSELPGKVEEKFLLLGLNMANAESAFGKVVQQSAAKLALDNSSLTTKNLKLTTDSSHFDFVTKFLSSIGSQMTAIEVAARLAEQWQSFYQTGTTCIYLKENLDAIVVENGQCKSVLLNTDQKEIILCQIQNQFSILPGQDCDQWFKEQIDLDFSRAKVLPLLSNGKAIGAIVCEFNFPIESNEQSARFEAITSTAASVIALARARQKQQKIGEQFAQLFSKYENAQNQITSSKMLLGLAEMAAGAAHEFNNPLSIISGRVQLLNQVETDEQKKQMLNQIETSTTELARIIEDLMSFAEPKQPRLEVASIKSIINQAVKQTIKKHNKQVLEIQINDTENVSNCFVDTEQITNAISNIFSNSLESYPGADGPIKLLASTNDEYIQIKISDTGCGMDSTTLAKATEPFFSAKPAGRQRGMGLAQAKRLIELNKGKLNLTSKPDVGTTVTVMLPISN